MRFGATNTGNRAEPVHPQVEGAGARVDRSYNHFDKVEACKLLRPHPGLAKPYSTHWTVTLTLPGVL